MAKYGFPPFPTQKGKKMQIGMLKLAGMRDEHCAVKLTQALKAVKGVDDAKISFDQSKATVSFDESMGSTQRMQVAVEEAGYRIDTHDHGEEGACGGGQGGRKNGRWGRSVTGSEELGGRRG